MIYIKYKLDRSNKHGIGIFADEDILNETLIYTENPVLDVNITNEEFKKLSDIEKNEVSYWGYFDENTNKWHVDFDSIKFVNHSNEGTITQDESKKEAYLIASRDIKKGEELTQNYLEFESKKDFKAREMKK